MDIDLEFLDHDSAAHTACENGNEAEVAHAAVQWHGSRHPLTDVLFPATPPEPKNPRVIRLFGLS